MKGTFKKLETPRGMWNLRAPINLAMVLRPIEPTELKSSSIKQFEWIISIGWPMSKFLSHNKIDWMYRVLQAHLMQLILELVSE